MHQQEKGPLQSVALRFIPAIHLLLISKIVTYIIIFRHHHYRHLSICHLAIWKVVRDKRKIFCGDS